VEVVLSLVLLVYAVRTANPLGPSRAYASAWVRLIFSALIAAPGIALLFVSAEKPRIWTLAFVGGTYGYVTILAMIADWTRFGSGGASLGWAALAFILYAQARAEVRRRSRG
jgi:hypothetical protein